MKTPFRFLLLIVATMLFSFSARAGNITEDQARAKAQSFLQSRPAKAGERRLAPARTPKSLRSAATGHQALYVFNIGEQDGFVIVSGDDRTRSILGYVDSGTFDADRLPAALSEMLAIYARQIEQLVQSGSPALDSLPQAASKAQARRRISGTMADVEPLLTTTWDQGDPYNAYCPTLDDQTALTGCVATAMAQIANYHKYPTTQVPSLAAYTSATNKINVSAWGATTFDWDNMLDSYSGTYTNAQKTAMATLMRYCGQAAQMDYGFTSGAYNGDALYAFKEKLGYNANAEFRSAAAYSADGWEDLIYKEVRENRPVYYSALNGDDGGPQCGGHAFVIDGYQADGNYFHVNWGWGGACNGYFNLFALDPDAPESSATSTGWHYQMLAIVGLSPEAEGPHQWSPTACEFKEGKPLYLRHVATGQYLTGANSYSTTTSLTSNGLEDTTNEPILFSITEETDAVSGVDVTGYVLRMDGTFRFDDRTFTNDEMMRNTETNCYVDRSGRDLSYLWKIVKAGNYYRIYTADGDPNFGGDGYMLGHVGDEGTIVRMFPPDEAESAQVDWEFVPFTYIEVASVTLDATHIELQQNEDLQLTATVQPNDARNQRVRWESDDESIATVNSEGLIHGVGIGTTVVRVITEDGGHEAECEVVVVEPVTVTRITLSEETLTIGGGERVTLQATVEPDDAQNKAVIWSVADATIASVNAKGVVRGLRVGTTTVTATAADGSGVYATCTVSVTSDDTSLETGWIIPKGTDLPWTMRGIVSDNEPDNDEAGEHWTSPNYDDSSWQDIMGPLSSNGDFFEGSTNLDRQWIRYYLRGTFYLPEMFYGVYTIHALHDDGMMMWINGQQVLDEGCIGDYGAYELSHDVLMPGTNTIAIHYWGDGNPNGFDYGLYYETLPDTYTDEQGVTYALDAKTMSATIIGCNADITEVHIPETISHCTVTGIADRAFEQAESLETITLRQTQPWTISETTFSEDAYSNATLKVPYEAVDAYREAEVWSRFQTITYFLPESYTDEQGIVYTLRDNSYYEVTGHTDEVGGNIVIASEISGLPVTVIGSDAFADCWDIESVDIPRSITTIRDHAFIWCDGITSITGMEGISDEEAYRAWDVFFGTSVSEPIYAGSALYYLPPSMTGEYEIPEGITMTAAGSIRESELSAIYLPASLKFLGDDTFQDCPNLTDIYCYATTPPECIDGVWENGFDRDACTIHVPASAIEDYQNADEWRDFVNIVSLYSGDEVIVRDGVLIYVPATTTGEFTVPEGVTEIADNAFSDCSLITKVVIGSEVVLHEKSLVGLSDIVEIDACQDIFFGHTLFAVGTTTTDYILPEACTVIHPYAFKKSTALKSLTTQSIVVIEPQENSLTGLSSDVTIYVYESMLDDYKQIWGANYNYQTIANPELGGNTAIAFTSADGRWSEAAGVWTSQNHDDDSSAEITAVLSVTAGEALSLDWSVSSEGDCDWLRGYWNDEEILAESGSNSGTLTYVFLETGNGTLKFVYSKDGSVAEGDDCASIGASNTLHIGNYTLKLGENNVSIVATTLTGDIVVPESFRILGKTYPVVAFERSLFYDNKLITSVTLPSTITAIPASAFRNCKNLKAVTIPESVKSIGSYAFTDCSGLTSIKLPESLMTIREFAFASTGLTSITIPDGVTILEHRSLQNCHSLTSITVGNGVTEIPECWAEFSDNLQEVVIGNNVTSVNRRAFPGFNIKNVTCYAKTPPSWDEAFYDGINQEAVLHVYSNCVSRYENANGWKDFPSIVGDLGTYPTFELAVGVTEKGTFSEALAAAMTAVGCEDMSDITKLTVTGNVNEDDLYYLRDNIGATLDALDLGAVTVDGNCLGDTQLARCGFEEVVLPNSITILQGWGVLEGCVNLKTVNIPSSVTYVCPRILNGATSLETVTGGEGVVEMDGGNGMYFDNCPNLQSPVILNTSFFRLPTNTEGAYEVPEGVTAIARDAMWNVSGLTALTLPESITQIYGNAFANDVHLKDIYFYAVELPTTDQETFGDFDRSACTLHVYEEMVEVFQGDDLWSEFNIVGDLGSMPIVTPMNEADYADLCNIYNTLGGDGWRTKWLTNANVQTASRWHGVTFDEDGYVTSINLEDNGLNGDISSLTFTGMSRLTEANLSRNTITGDIQPLLLTLNSSCDLNVAMQNLGYVGEHTLYELCNYGGLPSIAYYQSASRQLASTLIGVNGVCQFYHGGTDGGQSWDCYIYADGGTWGNFKFYWPSPVTVECFQPHHFTFTYNYAMGDANMDDELNVLDLQATLNYSNGEQWGLFNHYAADTYGQDDDINVQDIVATVNILLAQEESNEAGVKAFEKVPADEPEASVNIEGGQLVLYTTRPVAALDLHLAGITPEALRWNTEAMGFATAASAQADGTHAIIYSMQPRELEEGRTVLGTFDAGISPSLGTVVLSDSKARHITTGRNLPTGIRWTEDGTERSLYNLQGIKLRVPRQKGMYIEHGKKVIVK